jgi:hypothetical protein
MDPHSSNVPARQTFIRLTEGPGRTPWVLILRLPLAVYARLAVTASFAAHLFGHGPKVRSPRIEVAVYTEPRISAWKAQTDTLG